ncbi:hypothetical protein ACLEPN_19370 [Myxococcus sp. 1LA]
MTFRVVLSTFASDPEDPSRDDDSPFIREIELPFAPFNGLSVGDSRRGYGGIIEVYWDVEHQHFEAHTDKGITLLEEMPEEQVRAALLKDGWTVSPE